MHELLNLFYFLLRHSHCDCCSILYLIYFMYFRLPFTKGHFPKMAECAHFHYENVEFGSIQVYLKYFLYTELRHTYTYIYVSDRWHLEIGFSIVVLLVDGKTFLLFWYLMTPISSGSSIMESAQISEFLSDF